jgi:hypothetical protein
LNESRRDNDIIEREWARVRWKSDRTGMGDRKCMTITNNDTRESGDGRGSGEITRIGCHVGGGTAVHEPEVTCATSSASVGGGVEGVQKCRVDL